MNIKALKRSPAEMTQLLHLWSYRHLHLTKEITLQTGCQTQTVP